MRTLAIVCLSFGFAAVAAAQCRPPKYEQSERWSDNHPTIYIGTISMAPRDFGPVQLVCLAAALHEKYKNREEVFIYIFSSKKASRAPIAFQEIDQEIIDASLQLHAFYLWNRDSHEEYITLLPAGINPPSMGKTEGDLSTRIDLPVAAPPRCKVEVQRRRLLGIPSKYSMDVGRETGSGSVSLIGTATPDGRIQDVRVLGGSNLFGCRGSSRLLGLANRTWNQRTHSGDLFIYGRCHAPRHLCDMEPAKSHGH